MSVGIMMRHGGQLVEVISRMTGFLDFRTSFSKLLSLTLTILMSSAADANMAAKGDYYKNNPFHTEEYRKKLLLFLPKGI
jgi:hypothetical protein